jgi:hypothetical protein
MVPWTQVIAKGNEASGEKSRGPRKRVGGTEGVTKTRIGTNDYKLSLMVLIHLGKVITYALHRCQG